MKKPTYTKVRFTKRLAAILLALVCVVTLLPQGALIAQAADALVEAPSIVKSSSNALWVNGSNYSKDNSLDAIKWHYNSSEGKYYLYLPSSVDLNQLTVWHTFSDTMYVNGTKIQSGETTGIFNGGGNYTVKAGSNSYKLVVMQSQNINTMFISTTRGSLDAVNSSADKSVTDSGDIVYVDKKGNAASVAMTQIKGRGNSSWEAAQKLFYKYPYNIKLDKKTALFGMKKSKKWCLLANDFDQSLIRNKFIYDIAEDAGAAYTPEHEYADVYQNGRYIGNYLVTSKVEIDGNRVDVSDLEGETEAANSQDLDTYSRGGDTSSVSANTYKYVNIPNDPSDITGGYLLEFELDERYPSEISGFVSSKRQQVVVKSPEYASKAQVKYIRSYFQSMENAVYSSSGYNSEGKYYTEYMDMESAAQMYIIQELAMNVDAVSTSFYMYKDKSGKIYFGPSWDFDWAIGGYNRSDLLNTSKLLLTSKKVYNGSELNFMGALTKHSDFMDMVKKVWKEDFSPLLAISTGSKEAYTENVKSIKTYGSELEASANMNFSRFKFLGTTYWGSAATGSTYSDNINYVNNFIKKRVAYLNSVWGKGGSGDDEKTTVYFDNSNAKWSNVYAYVWNDTTDFAVFSGSLVSGTNNIYKFTINGSYSNILFKNTDGTTNWDKQTLDLEMPADDNNCYKPNNGSSKSGGSWYAYAEVTPTPVVTSEPTKTPEVTTPPTKTPEVTQPPVDGKAVYFDNSAANWTEVYAYVWNDTTDFKLFSPIAEANNIYTFDITGSYKNILFKNTGDTTTWKLQTLDLVMPTTDATCYKPNSGANKAGGSWYAYVTTTTEPTKTPEVTQPPVGGKTVYFDNSAANWTEVYAYVWNDTTDYKLFSPTAVANNIYTFNITGSYKSILFKNTGDTTTWKLQTTDLVMPTTGGNCYKPDNGANKANGHWYEYTVATPVVTIEPTKTPVITTEPTKTPEVTTEPTKTPEVTVEPTVTPANVVTLYYSTGWTKAYCHYKVGNGSWTKVPGEAMTSTTEQNGYNWKIVIDLKDATNATVCFNNGSGTWDSKDGENYIVYAGTYGVKNGGVNKLASVGPVDPTATPEITSTPVATQNQVVVYYTRATNTSWTNAYVHYKVNGTWTKAPGVKMTKISAGKWKYTIDLGTETSATACFNNGSGTWDNNDKNNYTLGKGTYEVTSGKVTKISD